LNDELMRAYQQTSFFADTPQGYLRLRIGERNPELDAVLAAESTQSWAYVTAYNPGSVAYQADMEGPTIKWFLHGSDSE
jgi:hypothetical protein